MPTGCSGKYTLGTHGALTLLPARAAAQKILLARLDGQDPAAARQARRKQLHSGNRLAENLSPDPTILRGSGLNGTCDLR